MMILSKPFLNIVSLKINIILMCITEPDQQQDNQDEEDEKEGDDKLSELKMIFI